MIAERVKVAVQNTIERPRFNELGVKAPSEIAACT